MGRIGLIGLIIRRRGEKRRKGLNGLKGRGGRDSKLFYSIREHVRGDFFEGIERGFLNCKHTNVERFFQSRHCWASSFAKTAQSLRSFNPHIVVRVMQAIGQSGNEE